ncbi:M24 family metallopeptidase [Aliikangiella sp. IMCC44653]
MINKNTVSALVCIFCGALSASPALAQASFSQGRVITSPSSVIPIDERPAIVNQLTLDRLENLLPKLMRESNMDMWLVIHREYEEDALFYTLVPQPTFAARRTTILVFFDRGQGKGVERITVSRYPIKGFYDSKWDGGTLDQQWQQLAKLIEQRDPQRIGINTSKDWPLADGLSHALYNRLLQALNSKYQDRIVSAENLVVRWMETRTAAELELYSHIVAIARGIIAKAFSNKVITPGVTNTNQVEWYIRTEFENLNLRPWFQPHVNVQRKGDKTQPSDSFMGQSGRVIKRGDILHTDVGLCYLTLCTDTQEMGYVLTNEQSEVPTGLKEALAQGNQWQDLLTAEFKLGLTGNQILANNLKANKLAKINATTYTHPIGFVGHSVGPTIGMWDNQGATPVRGDWPLYANTAYAIEGNIKTKLAEWQHQWVMIKLEQTAFFDGQKVIYAAGRQTQWHVVE